MVINCTYGAKLSKRNTYKSILVLVSILGLLSSIYGYYELLNIVPVYLGIFSAFEASLSTTSEFIIQTHNFYGLLSIIGLLPLMLTIFNKVSVKKSYLLVASNILLMLSVRWLIAYEFEQSIFAMGVIR